jgi:gas vesicle protein
MKNSSGIFIAFLGGALVGAALGILLAPDSGDETRKKIVSELEKRGIKLSKEELDDLKNDVETEV